MKDIRPEPVDVSPEDLRAGKFVLNPQAEAQRRASRRRTLRNVLLFALIVTALEILSRVIHWPR